MTHVFRRSTSIPLRIEEVFGFFADASNLEAITPPELRFHILTPEPIEVGEGTRIDYRLRLFGIPFRWRAEITHWNPPNQFVDEQVRGPFRLWVHWHRFVEGEGWTIVSDEVRYRLPLLPVGEMVFPLIHVLLSRIFAFRELAIRRALLGDTRGPCGDPYLRGGMNHCGKGVFDRRPSQS